MAILAARGAELIEELSQKKIRKQQEIERTVLEKIKNKMDSIKAAQKKIQGVQAKEPRSHYQAIRSGDYYMFDDNEEVNILESTKEDPAENLDDLDVDNSQTPTLGKLMETVMKTGDIKQVVSSDSDIKATRRSSQFSVTREPEGSDVSASDDEKECSTCQMKSTDVTSSKDVTDSSGRERVRRYSKRGKKDGRKDSESSHSTGCPCEECTPPESSSVVKCWDKFVTYLKFAIAFINSMMESIIQFLNQHSRDYRYVIKALDREKKALKETKNLRLGMRITPTMKWQPVPAGPSTVPPTSPLKIEEFDSEGLVTSTQPTFVRFLIAIHHALMSHSDMVCYFAVFILQMRNPTILSLPLPLMVFLWGTLSMPRPTKNFWVTIIAYTELIVVVKSICQSDTLPWNEKPLVDDKPLHLVRMLGIEKDNYYAIYDLALLLTVFFHRSTLKSLGLWKSTEESNNSKRGNALLNLKYVEPQSSEASGGKESDPATEITTVNLAISSDNILSEPTASAESDQSYQNRVTHNVMCQENSSKPLFAETRGFFTKLLDSQNRIADDVYAYMFFCDFVNIIVIIFGFSSFGAIRGDGGVTQYIEENKIPFTFLAMLLLQFGLIIMDRSLYLSKSIFGKIIFQYVLVIGVHIWMFFILPAVTDRQFIAVVPPSVWYLVKCCYLLLSAYQIRSGYPTRILGNFLCKNYNLVNMVLFKVFMMIPFVFELRTLMDWIWTETSMTLGDWITMEDIFAQIFQLKCTRRAESKYPLERGQKMRARTKILYGGGGLASLIALIWFPLVLFSLGNTVGKANMPWDITLNVKIGSYQSIFASSKDTVFNLTEDEFSKMKRIYEFSGNAQTFLYEYTAEDVGVVHLPSYSTSVWTIPPPEVVDFINALNNPTIGIDVQVRWTLHRRPSNPEERTEVTSDRTTELDVDIRKEIAEVLKGTRQNVTVPNLMPKFLKVTSVTPGTATPINQLMSTIDSTIDDEDQGYVNVTFTLSTNKEQNVTLSMWWNMFEAEHNSSLSFLKELPRNNESHVLTIYTFNDKAFPEGLLSYISGKGIIGLYTTFVIVVSAWIRGYFTGVSNQIMFEELPYVDRMLQLCLDIYLVRERRELDLEEDLFAKLIFLYRSPETMIKWTRPPAEDTNEEN